MTFGYQLKPTEVISVGSYVPQPRGPDLFIPPQDTRDMNADGVSDHLQKFDRFDWTTKLLLVVAICWLGWVYRRQISRLIPGINGNGNGAKKCSSSSSSK